jgi:hypothetical protein
MTWGEVEGTPMRVVEPFEEAEEMARSRRFRIQEPTYREKAAAALDDQQRKKKGSGAARKVRGHLPPLLLPGVSRRVRLCLPTNTRCIRPSPSATCPDRSSPSSWP